MRIYIPVNVTMRIVKFLSQRDILALDTCTQAVDRELMNALRATVRFAKALYLRMLAPPTHRKLYPHIELYVFPYVRDGMLLHSKLVRLMPLNMKLPKPPPFRLPCERCYPKLSNPRIIWTHSVQRHFSTTMKKHPAEPHEYRQIIDPKEFQDFVNNYYETTL